MRLTKLRIQNFKSVEDSTEFTVSDVTCLVGKNESGKTALLEALEALNPVVSQNASYSLIGSYPRRRKSEDEEKGIAQKAIVVTSTWKLEDADAAALAGALGVDVLGDRTVRVSKGYENTLVWDAIDLDEAKLVAHYLGSVELTGEERTPLEGARTIEELLQALRALQPATPAQAALLNAVAPRFTKPFVHVARETLETQLPKFLYFHRYYELPGKVSINDLLAKRNAGQVTDGHRVFAALLELVNKTPEAVQGMTRTEDLIAELEAISSRISGNIFEYWTQNKHLRVQFRCEQGRPGDPAPYNAGYVFETRIWNDRHQVSLNFDERSTGFVWFFSFLVWFWQVRRHYGANLFLLLDEPALNLHARAQGDLLRYINEKLKPEHQVMYTTHSPFMIDPDNTLAARTVEDVGTDKVEGSKVGDDVLSVDPDTVSPLQAALGYDVTQTLFVGKHTLLVEGPGDLLYLTWASQELGARHRTKLDPRWVISPTGGLDKIATFVTLFAGNKLHVAVLTDFHKGNKAKVEGLRASALLRAGHVFTTAELAGQSEADIEDMLGRANYLVLVNDTFGLEGPECMPEQKPAGASIRVAEEARQHFMTLAAGAPGYDHYAPAVRLMTDSARLGPHLPELESALDRFETLFKALNKQLPAATTVTTPEAAPA